MQQGTKFVDTLAPFSVESTPGRPSSPVSPFSPLLPGGPRGPSPFRPPVL